MNPTILGVIGPGFLNQVPTLGLTHPQFGLSRGEAARFACRCQCRSALRIGGLGKPNIGPLIIRIELWGPPYYSYDKAPIVDQGSPSRPPFASPDRPDHPPGPMRALRLA